MKRAVRLAFLLLTLSVVVASAQQPSLSSRDLQEMFYTDTLPPAKPPAKKPAPEVPVVFPKMVVAKPPTAQPTAQPDQSARRVGVKFRIQQWDEAGIRDVATSKVFHSGDRVRFEVESNIDGYLYVIQKGSSGLVSTLFPHLGINDGNNLVQRGAKYGVPASSWFVFDKTPGEENVMIILSRTPLESLPARPSAKPEAQVLPAVLTELDRRVQMRDLVLFSETETTDVASIVVNTSAEKNEVVYAEVVLKHQ